MDCDCHSGCGISRPPNGSWSSYRSLVHSRCGLRDCRGHHHAGGGFSRTCQSGRCHDWCVAGGRRGIAAYGSVGLGGAPIVGIDPNRTRCACTPVSCPRHDFILHVEHSCRGNDGTGGCGLVPSSSDLAFTITAAGQLFGDPWRHLHAGRNQHNAGRQRDSG